VRVGRCRALAALLAAALLPACMNLAPSYERPPAPVATAWPVRAEGTDVGAPAAADVAWSEFYGDAELRRLIDLALAANRDLRTTALDIEAARAAYRIARAAEFPTVVAGASLTRAGAGGGTNLAGVATSTRQVAVEAGISAFEVDLFGRLRNQRDQALETLLGAEETLRAARIALVAEVAIAWITLAADRQRLQLAEETLASQQRSYDLTRRTFALGAASGLDVAQARTSVDTARADIATYRTQVAQDLNALVLLVGQPLDDALVASPPAAGDRPLLAAGVVGPGTELPSDLLQRRPDVLAAERALRAANANVGAARAARFPTISLTTSVGAASASLGRLFAGGTGVWSFVPAVGQAIFDGGALRARQRAAEVQRETALARYDLAVQTAFREVADALAQRRDIDVLIDARRSLVAATERSYRLSEARYRRGVDSYLVVLDAQRSLYAAQLSLITARLQQAANAVTLYAVLGGGWREAAAPE